MTHGEAHRKKTTKEYRAWAGMKQRCRDPRCKSFSDYGGRGITVCPQWVDSFPAFLTDVGRAPSPAHTLGRIRNDENYEPGNVSWQTRQEQNDNTRRNTYVTINGVRKTVTAWCRINGISTSTMAQRLKYGWSLTEAVTIKVGGVR
jgi:hypothetical protein